MNNSPVNIICGIGGFLGSNLRNHFVNKGKMVIPLPTEMLLDPAGMHQFFREHEPYNLFYLAAYGNLYGQNNIREIYHAIIIKFLNVLEATLDTDCQAIITAGTTSEYGNKQVPMREDQLLEPETFYAAAKAGATHLAQVWARQYKKPVVVFRPASMTGVGDHPVHLIPTLIRSCLFKEVIPFVSEPFHDYINVLDVCRALEIIADRAKERKGEIFNIGSGIQSSNLVIKEMIEHITKMKACINKAVKLTPKNLSEVWVADSTKMRSLGWKPKIGLLDTLKSMVRAV